MWQPSQLGKALKQLISGLLEAPIIPGKFVGILMYWMS